MARVERRSGGSLRLQASHLIEVGRPKDAIPLLHQTIAADPDDSQAHCLLGLAHIDAGDPRAALSAVARADQSDEWPHRLRSIALLDLRKKRAALAAAREAVRLAPELPEALVTLIDAERSNRRLADAEVHAAVLRRVAPERSMTHVALGLVAIGRRRFPESEQHFRRALELDPRSWVAMNNLGLALRKQGRTEAAIAHFHEAARLAPTSKLVQRNLSSTVTKHLGSSFLGLGLAFQVVRLAGQGGAGASWVVGVAALAALAFAGWYFHLRHRKLTTLPQAVQTFYADDQARSRRTVTRHVLPRAAAVLAVCFVVCWIAGRLGYVADWDLWFLALALVGSVTAGIWWGVRRPWPRR